MSLIKSIDDIRKYNSINASVTLDNIQPDIDEVEDDYIIPALGKDQYESLDTRYNDANPDPALSSEEILLIELCQISISNLAYAKHIIVNRVQIDNSGITIMEGSTQRTAYKYMFDELIEYFEKRGFNYIDKVLLYLESEKDVFTLWANDESAYTINKKHFIQSAGQFNKHYRIGNSRRTFLALEPIIQQVEDFFIDKYISEDLSASLKSEIASGETLSENSQKLVDKIQPALAYLTIGHAIDHLTFEVSEHGLLIQEYVDPNKKKSAPSDSRLEVKRKAAIDTGNRYLDKLRDFLNSNATETVYADYYNSDLYTAPGSITTGRTQKSTKFYVA